MTAMKLLIVDDHPVVREGLASLLQQADPGASVLQAADAATALALAADHADLDVLFLDLILPGEQGVSAIREFGRRHPGLPVIVLSSSEAPQDVRSALAAGAMGYVPKSAPPSTLLGALRLVLTGEIYVPLLMAGDGPAPPRPRLTERQQVVLAFVCEGASNKDIARRLGMSDKTVKAHLTAIMRALAVTNRTQAARAAAEAGLI